LDELEEEQSQEKLPEGPADLADTLVKMAGEIKTNSLQAIENGINNLEGVFKNGQVKGKAYLKQKEFLQKQKKEIEECNFDVRSIAVVVQFRDREIPDYYSEDLIVGDKVISGISDSELYQKICYLKFFLETMMSRSSIAQIVSGFNNKMVSDIAKINSKLVDQVLITRLKGSNLLGR